ncbi:unnamed protein product [Linum tenue]|uniref:RING-type E3 ubiquitin transferase n=1 Tax=Linum tenue TaxID=586396 RepID=A0AAV0N2A7_9ROSI|nr:unnamed protein product [Linum tenue]
MSSYKALLRPRLENSVFDSLSQLGQERNSNNDDALSDADSVILNGPDIFDCENQVRFVMDLIHQRVEQSQVMGLNSHLVSEALNESAFGVIDEEDNRNAIRSLELDLGIGFGLGTHDNCGFHDVYAGDDSSNIDYHCNTVLDDIIDDDVFFIERRVSGLESRIVGFQSDSESEENDNSLLAIDFGSRDEYGLDDDIHVGSGHYDYGDGENDVGVDDDESITIPLCWNSLSLEDHRDHQNEDFEWEEVDGRVDEREVLSMFLDEDDDDDEASASLSISPIISPEDMVSVDRVVGSGNLEWEVLLDATNLGPLPDPDQAARYFGGGGGHDDDYIYTADYETVFGQFAEMDTVLTTGQPPASRLVVERLPSVVVTKEDAGSDNSTCAVCKDDMSAGEKAKLLPCTHRYHEECIVPWLNIRNTCPVCRHELPTDDPDYERRKMVERSSVAVAAAVAAGQHHAITM